MNNEQKEFYGYIYLTTNLVNNKKYIGQHKGKPNDSYLGSGIHIKQAIKKYGKENFKKEVLEYANSQEELNELERKIIALHNAVEDKNYYNVAIGGYTPVVVGGMKGKKHTKETKQKLRELNMGENNPMFGKYGELKPNYGSQHSEETKKKISETRIEKGVAKGENNPMYGVRLCGELNGNYGKHLTQEQKQKISETRIEKGVAKGENNPMYGKKHSEESRRKMSDSLKGREMSEETRLKISYTLKEQYTNGQRNNGAEKLQKPVYCITTGEKFKSAKEAAKKYGIKSHDTISKCCRGVVKSAGKLEDGTKLKWEYIVA